MKEKEEGKEKEKMPGTSALTPPSDIGDEGTKALDGLKDIIGEVIYDVQRPSITITSSTASTTTTSVSTTSSFEKSASSSSSSSTPSLSSSSSSSEGNSSITLSSTTVSLVTEDISTELSGESTIDAA